MLNYWNHDLDQVFTTLADPTRRVILARLEREESPSINALAAAFAIKSPAVMRRLEVLSAQAKTKKAELRQLEAPDT